ncbi:MAG TPA: hypothetical protein VNL91_09115 [Thermoanaerobaculia bacterium]|nr:hypothetical protein [Thermoanaerobaculia bacterium]
MASRKHLSPESAEIAIAAIDESINNTIEAGKLASPADLAPHYAARAELAAFISTEAPNGSAKKSRTTTKGRKRGLPATDEATEIV